MIPFDGSFAAQTRAGVHRPRAGRAARRAQVSVGENFRFGHRAKGDAALLRCPDGVRDPRRRAGRDRRRDRVLDAHPRARDRGRGRRRAAASSAPRSRCAATVAHGDKRGRTLGFPTANLVPDSRRSSSPATASTPAAPEVGGRAATLAAVNVGVRPTFKTGRGLLVEAFLLDFDGDLYGQELRLDFLQRLRGEKRFDTVDALVEQMHRDVDDARRIAADRRSTEARRMRVRARRIPAPERRAPLRPRAHATSGHDGGRDRRRADAAVARAAARRRPTSRVRRRRAARSAACSPRSRATPTPTARRSCSSSRPGWTLDDAPLGAARRGVQDFLVEPVGDAELVARVESAGRTQGAPGGAGRAVAPAGGAAVRGPAHRPLQPPLHPHPARRRGQRRPPPRAARCRSR